MGARLRSWWQIVRKSLAVVGIIVACVLGITLIVVIALAYIFNVNIPGLHGKTLWDWLQLLIIPPVLAVIALLFNRATTRTDQKIAADRYQQDKEIASRHYHQDRQIAERRYQNDRSIALDKQREDLLQSYLDRMSELLLKEKLRSSANDAEVRNVARVRTITILFQLDARRIGYVFAFLREAGLVSNMLDKSVVNLSGADFSKVHWSQTNIREVDLSQANFHKANLIQAFLFEVNLRHAMFLETNLFQVELREADLSGAYLTGSRITEEQLKEVKSLYKAFMPDGSIHP